MSAHRLKRAGRADEAPRVEPGAKSLESDGVLPVVEAHQRCFDAGSLVFDEGEAGHSLFFIRSGEVELARRGAAGALPVARLGPGEFFGEQGVLVAGPRRSRATVTREAELLEVGAGVFEEMFLERPDIALRITRALASRAQALEQRLASLEGEDALRALARALLRLSRPGPDGASVEGTLRSLAAEAGLGLLEAHHALQHLVERKAVRLVEDVLQVADAAALSSLLESPADRPSGR